MSKLSSKNVAGKWNEIGIIFFDANMNSINTILTSKNESCVVRVRIELHVSF